ncbi:PIG-L family deacetylase [Shimia sp.]|uniref:PIG-L family deacetylase n=1 Tax=Shimia sp. TaxID=1954381 RepID=UPI003297457C
MPTPDQMRLEQLRARPRIMELWWALRPLTSVVRFMQTGAHPDDEITGMLAALAFRDGVNLSYACSTRGEGGQNDIGTESGAALGALRTREMERACDVLGMRMYWHSETARDTITDFGFSKSGTETLGRWGHERTLARFVDIVRVERPDIICPTFLDVPGQHGHHRAMTEVAHEVMAAAADPEFPSNRPLWQVKKMYLPAWSGAGQSYDDDLPPPPATLTIDGSGCDEVSGWSWERIGQQSRGFHRTQGMGRWQSATHSRDWPLHLAQSHVDGPDHDLSSGLCVTVGDLAALPGAEVVANDLRAAQGQIDIAVAAYPNFEAVAEAAIAALSLIGRVRLACPAAVRDEVDHRLDAKEVQLARVVQLALGVDVTCFAEDAFVSPGSETAITLDVGKGLAEDVRASLELPDGWSEASGVLRISENAFESDGCRAIYDPMVPDAPACRVWITWRGANVSLRMPMDNPPVVLPACRAHVSPAARLVNLSQPGQTLTTRVDGVYPKPADATILTPEGWRVAGADGDFSIDFPKQLSAGLYELPVLSGGVPAQTVDTVAYAHVAPTAVSSAAQLRVLALEAQLPDVRVGYVGAGNDRVDYWLSALGMDVTGVTDEMLTSDAALSAFDTIVIGIFALRFRPGLSEAMPALHRWVETGGTLVTLYHRPWDNWDPVTTPPRHIEIGQPSLRWRVTDETAEVRHLAEHSIFQTPNQIGPQDWAGWVKERGLYFAKSWDAAYIPLIEMADPEEASQRGALLVGDVGRGRHVHTSLILHHQMENLVPGAFRLMANLLSKR